jgi:Spy/CpxP family protein refolding chaperone
MKAAKAAVAVAVAVAAAAAAAAAAAPRHTPEDRKKEKRPSTINHSRRWARSFKAGEEEGAFRWVSG